MRSVDKKGYGDHRLGISTFLSSHTVLNISLSSNQMLLKEGKERLDMKSPAEMAYLTLTHIAYCP